MGFGRFRFKRSFGQVKSTFRGARPDTYPIITSPTGEPGVYDYKRPGGIDLYRQPDTTSLYKRP